MCITPRSKHSFNLFLKQCSHKHPKDFILRPVLTHRHHTANTLHFPLKKQQHKNRTATNRTEGEAESRFPLSIPELLLYFNQKHFLKHPNSVLTLLTGDEKMLGLASYCRRMAILGSHLPFLKINRTHLF